MSHVADRRGVTDRPQCVASRTFNVLPIVEGVYDMGNLAAVARSADGEGSVGLGGDAASSRGFCHRHSRRRALMQRLSIGLPTALQRSAWGQCTSSTAGGQH